MWRPLRVCVLSLALIACGAVACNQILGNGDFVVDSEDSGNSDAATIDDRQTITDPVGVATPIDSTTPEIDSGHDAGPTYPDAAAFPDAAVVWLPASGGNGHGYLVVVGSGASVMWDDANAVAVDAGGHLATIANTLENQFLTAYVVDAGAWPAEYGPWLGGYQPAGSVEPDGGWTWVTNEPFSYQNWRVGEPNDEGDEDRLEFYGSPVAPDWDGTWNDANHGDTAITSFLIEFE